MRFVYVIFLACLLLVSPMPSRAEVLLRQPAPPLVIKTFSGDMFDLSQQRGHVVLVTFWASWCAPCLAEMPDLERFYRTYQNQGVEVIALSVDFAKDRDKARRLMSRVSFPGGLLSESLRNGFPAPDAVPMMYVIDGHGEVRDAIPGATYDILRQVVLPLLGDRQAPADYPMKSISYRPAQ